MLSRDNETIVAQCTPSGSGAIALIRLCGDDVFSIVDQISDIGKKLISQVTTHTIHYGSVIENGTVIDLVLFLVMHGPNSFTGQHTVEITCHNNPFIIEAIIQAAINAGARLADNGEFTKRAVLHNKIDLLKAEAVNELIHANTQQALKQSLQQLGGSLSSWIHTLEKQLIQALALSEASFEFLDEEDLEFATQIKTILADIESRIEKLKKTFDQQQQIRSGIRIALVGSVNAGKSSLFNTLLDSQRAIVTDTAGTTRDVIEAGLYKNGNYWTLIDTAGIRETNNSIEKEGIKRSLEEAQKADILLVIIDGSRAMSIHEQAVYTKLYEQFTQKCIVIRSKADLPAANIPWLENKKLLSTAHHDHAKQQMIEAAIQAKIEAIFQATESPFLVNKRQYHLLINLEQKLKTIRAQLKGEIAYELVSYHLNEALSNLAELTGKSISEAGMDAVFREFCVGK